MLVRCFINGLLLVRFFSSHLHPITMEEQAHDGHSDPERALYRRG
jgi:hypothetical protein